MGFPFELPFVSKGYQASFVHLTADDALLLSQCNAIGESMGDVKDMSCLNLSNHLK